ncbi:MAG TPA: hypothetical protein VHN78_04275, partial [Chloroflexota bacterium]|nr:hypothetical protein [Chloroflexota bacterium]
MAQSGQARVERLHPLSEAACRALLSRHLGRRVSRKLVRHAHASTAGNPLLLEQLALTLNTGQPTKDLGSWHLRPGGLVLSRFAGLPEEGLRCARAASVLGSRFRPEVATALARLDGEEADLAREALSRTGLVRQIDIGLAEFTHPLLRDALYDDLPPLTREALHARAFGILSQRGMETEAAEHAARGNLLGDGSAIEVLTRSGQAALRTGAVAVATERLKRAVALAGDRPRADLLLLCGEALLAEGRGHEAATVYERLLRQTDSAAETTTQALRMLGRALFLSGDPVEGERRFEQAAALASKDHPTAAVQAVLDLSRAAWLTAGPAGALPFLRRARETARHADEACRAEIEAAWGFVAFVSGDPAGLEATRAPARLAAASDMSALRDLSWHWGSLRNSGRAAKYAERFDEAEAAFSAMFVQAERAQSAHAIVSLAAHHADALIRRGRLEEAVPLASRAVDLADLAPMAAGFAHVAQASLLVHFDQWE